MIERDISRLGEEPFTDGDLDELRRLAADGLMRRFGAVVNHAAAGFTANALTAWDVGAEAVDAVGEAFAREEFASHVVARPRAPGWPYNLYAMIHARSEEELERCVERLGGLSSGAPRAVMRTLREYKKTSLWYNRRYAFSADDRT